MKWHLSNTSWKYKIAIIVLILMGFIAVKYVFRSNNEHQHKQEEIATVKYWTCSMHPQIKLPKPGKCPICAMNLIPVSNENTSVESVSELVLSEAARSRAKVTTQAVKRKFVETTISISGKVAYDETRLSYITSWIDGRIDRLFVDYTGITVSKGDHMVYIYSPELLSAQEEYLETLRANTISQSSAKEKLRLFGITDEQIKEIEKKGIPREHMTIYSPVGGVVVSKHVNQGVYVKTGTKIYTIADLEHVWVILDLYESDARFVQYGQKVIFETESLPGEKFEGTVVFVHPTMDEGTRTIKVRVNVSNEKKLLKPGMFIRANIFVSIGEHGPRNKTNYADKWICPMHLEVLKSHSGNCPICGMKLKKAEDVLEGVSGVEKELPPLVIPVSAPLITGKRAVVYVEKDSIKDTESIYEGREIILGPRAGDYYIVKAGLKEGDKVVTKGNFKIDSALQIEAKPSMMNPDGSGGKQTGHAGHQMGANKPNKKQSKKVEKKSHRKSTAEDVTYVSPVYKRYFSIQKSLSEDNYKKAFDAINVLGKEIINVKKNITDSKLKTILSEMEDVLVHKEHVQDINGFRSMLFGPLSNKIIELEEIVGHKNKNIHYKMFCPMINEGQGGLWLQNDDKVQNPYYGKDMISCGEIQDTYYSKK